MMSENRTSPVMQHLQLAWVTFQRTWKWTLPLGLLLSAIAGATLWCTMTPVYESRATLLIRENTPYVAFRPTEHDSAFVRTQLQLFYTRKILGPALERILKIVPDAADKADPYAWLEENLRVEVVSGSELVRVTFKHPVPQDAQEVLQAIVEEYIVFHKDTDRENNQRVIGILMADKEKRAERVEELRMRVREKSRALAFSELSNLPGGALSPLDEIQEMLVQTEVEMEINRARLSAAKEALEGNPPEILDHDLEQIVNSQPFVRDMQIQLAGLTETLANLKKAFVNPEANSTYQNSLKRRAEIEAKLEAFREEFSQEAERILLADMRANAERQVRDLEQEIASQDLMRAYLKGKLNSEHSVQTDTSEDLVLLDFAKGELAREEEIFNRISDRIITLSTELVAPARVEPIDLPNVPKKAVSTPFSKITMVCLGVFFIPLIAVTLTEHLVQRVTDAAGIREQSLPVIAEVAMLPRYVPPTIVDSRAATWRPATLFEESVDHLSANLRLSKHLQETQVLAIVSAVSGEGKTHVSTQLAISLAKLCKEPVILVESDFRAPDIDELLGITPASGLLDVLSGESTLDDAVIKNVNTHLDVLTAGKRRRNLHAILHEQHIQSIFEDLRSRYRYIVIDTPPILGAGEALLFTSQADATLICARRGYSRVAQVREVHDRLSRTQAQPLGVVLNGVPSRQYVYSYGSYV